MIASLNQKPGIPSELLPVLSGLMQRQVSPTAFGAGEEVRDQLEALLKGLGAVPGMALR